ncbi:MAG TPA: M28 family peptidase [Bryobacteraceae bacterium]|nr:M28 family peptidase [Bryobacteraceae bacterium]
MKRLSLYVFCTSILLSQTPTVPANLRQELQLITPANLKGDLSFLASDTLQGRYTPSPGLDVAAEFIASQFRAAGLEPGGDQDYFQIANMVDRRMPTVQSIMNLQEGSQSSVVPVTFMVVTDTSAAANIEHAPVIVFKAKDPDSLKGVDLAGKAVVAPGPSQAERRDINVFRKSRAFDQEVGRSGAALEITVGPIRPGQSATRLIEADLAQQHHVPSLTAESVELHKWIDQVGTSSEARTVSVSIPAPDDQNVTVKNVVGVLRGSDPALKNTYVMLTAHYDHVGTTETAGRSAANRPLAGGDHIFNGANDDGSGTVSVIEIARAMAHVKPRPKRSMIFMTFFGEERGLLGSQFYGRHPRFPVADTVADLNLEQVGRTDSTEGPQVNTASLTGYDYSDVTKYLGRAGRALGVKVYLDKTASDPYFTRSDNAALAELGVPAETLTVAFDYPDYHGLGDEWQKVDYDNMARVDRMVALGLFNIANSANPPQWNTANPKTLPFREAQQKLLGQESGR